MARARAWTRWTVIGTLAAAAATPPAPAAGDPPRVTTTVLATVKTDVEGVDGQSLTIAPNSAHLAFRAQQEAGSSWYVDGTAGAAYEEVGPLVHSEDGARWAHFGRSKEGWTLVVDGKERALPAGLSLPAERSLRFSPDGKKLAFQASRIVEGQPPGEVVCVDGTAGPPFQGIEYASIVFSRDGTHVAYRATDGAKDFVVADGTPGKAYARGSVGNPAWSANGAHHGYTVKDGPAAFVVIDAQEGKKFDRVSDPVFSPAGGRWFHVGLRGKKAVVVTDGKESAEYADLAAPGPAWSPDGARLAYAVKKEGGFVVVLDGVEGPVHPRIGGSSLRFSPDGKRFAYWATARKAFYVVDGVAQPEVDLVATDGGAAFSPDGKRVAYSVGVGGKWKVRVDGVDGPEFDGIGAGFPVFSPAGRLVYQAQRAGKWHVVIDGEAGPAFDGVAEGSLAFGQDGSTVACVVRRGQGWRIAVNGVEGEEYQALLPGSIPAADGPRSFHAWFARMPDLLHVRVAAGP